MEALDGNVKHAYFLANVKRGAIVSMNSHHSMHFEEGNCGRNEQEVWNIPWYVNVRKVPLHAPLQLRILEIAHVRSTFVPVAFDIHLRDMPCSNIPTITSFVLKPLARSVSQFAA